MQKQMKSMRYIMVLIILFTYSMGLAQKNQKCVSKIFTDRKTKPYTGVLLALKDSSIVLKQDLSKDESILLNVARPVTEIEVSKIMFIRSKRKGQFAKGFALGAGVSLIPVTVILLKSTSQNLVPILFGNEAAAKRHSKNVMISTGIFVGFGLLGGALSSGSITIMINKDQTIYKNRKAYLKKYVVP